jgi:hypothetical protein
MDTDVLPCSFCSLDRCSVNTAYHVVFFGQDAASLTSSREQDMVHTQLARKTTPTLHTDLLLLVLLSFFPSFLLSFFPSFLLSFFPSFLPSFSTGRQHFEHCPTRSKRTTGPLGPWRGFRCFGRFSIHHGFDLHGKTNHHHHHHHHRRLT